MCRGICEKLRKKTAYVVLFLMCFFVIPIKIKENQPIENKNHEVEFHDFVQKLDKWYRYKPEEYENRYKIFTKTKEIVNALNKDQKLNNSAKYGITKFSDLSPSEFRMQHLNKKSQNITLPTRKTLINQQSNNETKVNVIKQFHMNWRENLKNLPSKIDYREMGFVSDVRNQGVCGACWIHSVLGTIESMIGITFNRRDLPNFSVQQIIDCSYNNYGCDGGDTCELLNWLWKENIFLELSQTYRGVCHRDVMGFRVSHYTCQSFVNREYEMLNLLATHGPLTVGINGHSWQNYLNGIIQYHCIGGRGHLNHAAQIVGYDITGNIPYYIVKNSWGTDFGEDGYVRIAVGQNMCGIADEVSIVDVQFHH